MRGEGRKGGGGKYEGVEGGDRGGGGEFQCHRWWWVMGFPHKCEVSHPLGTWAHTY